MEKVSKMTKQELLSSIAKEAGVSSEKVKDVLRSFQSQILKELRSKNVVTVLEIGQIKIVKRAARKGINPLTKKPIEIPAKGVAKLTPSRKFKEFASGSSEAKDFNY